MSFEARVLDCANCGAPTAFLAAMCAYCRSPLTWHDVPTLRRGAPILEVDFSRGETLPGMHAVVGLETRPGQGVVIPIPAHRQVFLPGGAARRDVALRVEATALVPGVGFGLEMRVTSAGKGRASYAVKILPWLRAFRLDRLLSLQTEAFVETLRAPETVPQIGGPGEPVVLEARCADSILSIHVGGVHIGTFVDARYGFGAHGLTVNGFEQAGGVLFKSFGLYEVA
ncbi:MAG: hypothetical protein JNL21_01725 [Myxococcales bacterium]|nr:hypothetical protein [Myxococcales bacterium]